MGFKEWVSPNTPARVAKRAELKERWAVNNQKMAAANADLRSGLAATGREWAEDRQMLAGERRDIRAVRAAKGVSFEGVTLAGGRVTYKGQGGSVVGAVARVESAADVHARITAGRVLALGIFALGAKKQKGHIYLTVEAPGFEFVVELPVKKEADARAFAVKVNNAAKAA